MTLVKPVVRESTCVDVLQKERIIVLEYETVGKQKAVEKSDVDISTKHEAIFPSEDPPEVVVSPLPPEQQNLSTRDRIKITHDMRSGALRQIEVLTTQATLSRQQGGALQMQTLSPVEVKKMDSSFSSNSESSNASVVSADVDHFKKSFPPEQIVVTGRGGGRSSGCATRQQNHRMDHHKIFFDDEDKMEVEDESQSRGRGQQENQQPEDKQVENVGEVDRVIVVYGNCFAFSNGHTLIEGKHAMT